MLNVFKGTLLSLSRDKGLLVWALAFPIVLSSMFMIMFSGVDELDSFNPIPCAVVDDENYAQAPAFSQMLEALSQDDSDRLLNLTIVESEQEARALLEENASLGSDNGVKEDSVGVIGYYTVDSQGNPVLHTAAGARKDSMLNVYQSILKQLSDGYLHRRTVFEDLALNNPAALTDQHTIGRLVGVSNATERISLTHNAPKESVRYYFALLGMATLFCGQIALLAICRTQPNLSALGARRALGGVSRIRTLTATLLASWLLSFTCLIVAFLFMRFVANVDFGEREAACIGAIAVAALYSTAFGTLIGALPKITEGAKSGLLTAATCLSSLFAGLYGQPVMRLADDIAEQMPLVATFNPASQIAQTFFSIAYYDTYGRYFESLALLVVAGLVLFAVSALFIRRQRYASL